MLWCNIYNVIRIKDGGIIISSELNFDLFSIYSRETYNKWQAQKWWAENYERVMELYNVQKLNRQAFPLPTPPRCEDEVGNSGFMHILDT